MNSAKDLWTPRPRDLPSARTVRLAPELAGVEHNPVFRRALHRGRSWRRVGAAQWTRSVPFLLLDAVAFWFILLRTPTPVVLILANLVIFMNVLILPRLGWKRPESLVGGLSIREWADLADAGYPARDAAIGCWAPVAVRFDRSSRVRWFPGTAMLVGGYALRLFDTGPAAFPSILLYTLGSVALGWAVVGGGTPYGAIGMLRFALVNQTRMTMGGISVEDQVQRQFSNFSLVFGLGVIAILLCSAFLAPPMILAMAATTGVAGNLVFRRVMRFEAAERFDGLVGDIARIMEHAQRVNRPEDMR